MMSQNESRRTRRYGLEIEQGASRTKSQERGCRWKSGCGVARRAARGWSKNEAGQMVRWMEGRGGRVGRERWKKRRRMEVWRSGKEEVRLGIPSLSGLKVGWVQVAGAAQQGEGRESVQVPGRFAGELEREVPRPVYLVPASVYVRTLLLQGRTGGWNSCGATPGEMDG
ncbi:hypothetical protein LY76DRAFT_339694 [Colletotrichum caudatum]|nr:hypothetical protein LY76DRAFT_339694 [Colletotrichum caudatum]